VVFQTKLKRYVVSVSASAKRNELKNNYQHIRKISSYQQSSNIMHPYNVFLIELLNRILLPEPDLVCY